MASDALFQLDSCYAVIRPRPDSCYDIKYLLLLANIKCAIHRNKVSLFEREGVTGSGAEKVNFFPFATRTHRPSKLEVLRTPMNLLRSD